MFCDSYYLGSMMPNIICDDEEHLKMSMRHILEVNHFHNTQNIGFVEMNAYGFKVSDLC